MSAIRDIDFTPELEFRVSRSGGAGGQHVNKVETRIQLRFNILASALLSEGQKTRLLGALANRLVQESELQIVCSEARSQLKNKEIAVKRFYDLLEEGLKVPKKRKRKKPSRASKERRLKAKKVHSEKKASRRWKSND